LELADERREELAEFPGVPEVGGDRRGWPALAAAASAAAFFGAGAAIFLKALEFAE
jgi:hypothetical protein